MMNSESQSKPPGKPAPRWILKTLTKVHVFLHRLAGGRAFNSLGGDPVCFVTMTGAKSGREITIPLIYVPKGEGVLLVASQTGRPNNPAWYYNLVKNPDIVVRYCAQTMELRARLADSAEKDALWPLCDEHYADFAEYRRRTDRDIPIFVCEPV
jgi:deazaflavin-dependent oxidoreductase (nitroreductase family)